MNRYVAIHRADAEEESLGSDTKSLRRTEDLRDLHLGSLRVSDSPQG